MEVRQLPFDVNVYELALDNRLEAGGQLGHRNRAALAQELFKEGELRHSDSREQRSVVFFDAQSLELGLELFPIKRLEAENGSVHVKRRNDPLTVVGLLDQAGGLD